MANAYLIAVIVEGLLLICLALVVLGHSRLLGLLHMRLGPVGARPLADGPAIGTKLSELCGKRLNGAGWHVRFPQASDTILVFVSPQCQTCNALMPHVRDFLRANPHTALWLVSTIDDINLNRAYVAYRRIEALPYILGEALARSLDIEATPYALRIDSAGVVRAKGVVNNYENLALLSCQDLTAAGPAIPAYVQPSPVSLGGVDEAMAAGR